MEVEELARKVAELEAEKERLERKNRYLEERLKEFARLAHGSKRERFVPEVSAEQMALFGDLKKAIEQGEKEKQKITYERDKPRKEKPFRKPLPDHFPREEIIVEPDFDTTGWKKIGKEVTEELEYVPAFFKVFCYIRYKYVNPEREEDGVKIAPLPARPIEKGIAGAGLLARIIIDKFCDHLPFYRQQRRFKREGYEIPASTLEGWFNRSCDLLSVLYEVIKAEVLRADYLQADETPIKVLDKNKKAKTHRGYHWIYHAPKKKLTFFDYRPGRSRAGPAGILQDYQGWLQTDGYSVYDDFEKRSGIYLVGCMAHARRYFERALDSHPVQAGQILKWIQELYAIERKAREYQLTPEQRLAIRKAEAFPIIKQIAEWMVFADENPSFLPREPMGKAYTYLLHRFDYLKRYLEDGHLEIDNNLAENLIRPIAIGRKNYLFAGSHKGAQRAAMAYSIIASCKLNGIDPFTYIKDVLRRLPQMNIKEVGQLLPGNWMPS